MARFDPNLRTLHPPTAEPLTRAYVNHGRWIVECQCRAAHEIRPGVKTWKCMMMVGDPPTPVGCGSEYAVLWPAPKLRRQIEIILSTRPYALRNWWPWERLDQLISENLEHGCAVPAELRPGGDA